MPFVEVVGDLAEENTTTDDSMLEGAEKREGKKLASIWGEVLELY